MEHLGPCKRVSGVRKETGVSQNINNDEQMDFSRPALAGERKVISLVLRMWEKKPALINFQ